MAKKNKCYVVFTLMSGGYGKDNYWTKYECTRQELIRTLAYKEYYTPGSVVNNTVKTLDNTYMDKEIIKSKYDIIGYSVRYINKYLIAKKVNDEYNVLDVTDFLNEINKAIEIRAENAKKSRNKYLIKPCYQFRKDPVPYVHKIRFHRGCVYRHPSTTKSKRNNFYVDAYGVFIDTKIKSLPNVYDDIVRHKDKSWKTSCKVRKQWQKHIGKHVDTVDYNRKAYNIEYFDEEE